MQFITNVKNRSEQRHELFKNQNADKFPHEWPYTWTHKDIANIQRFKQDA